MPTACGSISLASFEPLARVPGVQLFSLQKGFGTEQIAELAGRFPITELGSQLHDFMDTAAVMQNLDLVISADSSPAHVAGARECQCGSAYRSSPAGAG